MPRPPHRCRVSRTAVAALGAAGLIALGAAPPAIGDEPPGRVFVGGVGPLEDVKPESVLELPVTVVNKGASTVDEVWIKFTTTRGLDMTEVPANCRTQFVGAYDEMPERWIAVCRFRRTLKPGVVHTLERPFTVKTRAHAFDDEMWVSASNFDPGSDENNPPSPGNEPAVGLVEAPGGAEGTAEEVKLPVRAANTADYEVTGGALRGNVGDTVTMKGTFTNNGPAWVYHRPETKPALVRITFPAGTSVVRPDPSCRAEGEMYICGALGEKEHVQDTFAFKLRIDKKVPGAKGSLVLTGVPLPFDTHRANNAAPISLEITGSDTGAGPSSAALPIAGAAAAGAVVGAGAVLAVHRRRTRSPS